VDPDRKISWRRGQSIFDSTLFAQAIEELNLYFSTRIALADSALADFRRSGTFATGGTSAFAEAVTAYFPVQIEHTDAATVTLEVRS
jgi:ferric-dicitrate binding protein FerR (iron transport regulator)